MRKSIIISALLLLLPTLMIGSVNAYEYRMPVNIQPMITPAVLMPGDEAVVAIELQNGAAAYGTGGTAGSGTPAAGTILSTPIDNTTLKGTDEIQVTSADYHDLGMIGPNDRITIYYKIEAAKNASSGTHFLKFRVQGGYDMIPINREIPVKVDPASVGLARADVPDSPSISLNVANPRENTLNAVTIVPTAKGVRFSPEEYYIGTMDPDEVFTISFDLDSGNKAMPIKGPVNLSFVSQFKNGDTWHDSAPYITTYMPPVDRSNQNGYLLPLGAVALIALAAGVYLYWRKKNSKGTGKQEV